ncbi:hypothetical protein [Aquimarina sp. 2201CG5-10]|uniref:tetratricopeptide repeat protein n=1 Tax=Aquimarina callyspongiae TaxID=3098150 RepID=UPI002AB41CC8|nr:hypothetical protein [Aquimarina sp. 2201CG5-10]MDY8136789.1 hypothetical protein [Aquimarina sp. 2201CG5-10]
MTPEEKYELFERYCSDEISTSDKERLTQLIKESDELKEEFKLYQELNSHLQTSFTSNNERIELENNLRNIGDSYFNQKLTNNKPKVIKMPVWAYAVAASVAVVFGVYFFGQSNPVYKDYASIPELTITERGIANDEVKSAENAFNSENYALAEEVLAELLTKNPSNTQYQFYYGISLLEQDKYEKATVTFKKLQKGNSVFQHKALWFEALNQLKQKKYNECVELLKILPEEAEDYNKAQELLKRLD